MGRSRLLAAAFVAASMVVAACSDPSSDLRDAIAEAASTTVVAESGAAGGAAYLPDPDPTPLPVDGDLRLGRLDNGLTYYLRSNDSPGASVDVRLVVDAGSLHQVEPDDGIAHFLEHMLFNGTERFPGNELDRALQTLGIEFGADLNAFTSHDETVYLLAATTDDESTVDLVFDVLREWVTAASLLPVDVEAEIGVVREEFRFRNETPDGAIGAAFDDIYTRDTPYEGRSPIGSVEAIEATTPEAIRAYYEAWYRPDNMAVIAVGDLPLDDLDERVRDSFGDLAAAPTPVDAPPREVGLSSEPVFEVVTHPERTSDNLSIDLPLPIWDASTVGGARLVLVEDLVSIMLTNRLVDAFLSGELAIDTEPFFAPFAHTRALRYYGTNLQADDLAASLTQFMSVIDTAAAEGFTDAELSRAVDEYEAFLDSELANEPTRQDADYATRYMTHYLAGADIDSTERRTERERALLGEVGAAELSAHWAWLRSNSGPIVVAIGADPAELPSEPDLVAALAAVEVAAAPTEEVAEIDRLMEPPEPAAPVDVVDTDELWRSFEFDNGAFVVVVPSEIEAGGFYIDARSDGGWSLLDPGDIAITQVVTTAVDASGVADVDPAQLDRFLAEVDLELASYIDETTEGFVGHGSVDDLEAALALMHLRIVAPRADDAGTRVAHNLGENLFTYYTEDPEGIEAAELADAITGGSAWWTLAPTREQLGELDAAELAETWSDRLSPPDDLAVVLVGDVDLDAVGELVARYIGTLPAGEPETHANRQPGELREPDERLVPLGGDVTAAGVQIAFEAVMPVDAATQADAAVLRLVLEERIRTSIREELGASYGGTAFVDVGYVPDDRVSAGVAIGGDPDQLDEITRRARAILASLASDGPEPDELARATAVLESEWNFLSNVDIANQTHDGIAFPERDLLDLGDRLGLLEAVTADSVRLLAARVFDLDRAVTITRTVQ